MIVCSQSSQSSQKEERLDESPLSGYSLIDLSNNKKKRMDSHIIHTNKFHA